MKVTNIKISLDSMRFYSCHGVMPQERKIGAFFTVDLTLTLERCPAVMSDKLTDTIDYSAAYALVKEVMSKPSLLLENAAGRILEAILNAFPEVVEATVRIAKDAPPMAGFNGKAACVELTAR